MKVKPMHGDVHSHAYLKAKCVGWVEQSEHHHQHSRSASVRQLVQHGTEFRTLVEETSGVTIHSVQERANQIAPYRRAWTALHEVHRQHRQANASIADEVGDEEENIFLVH